MTNEEISSKIHEMRRLASELEREYSERIIKMDHYDVYTWGDARDFARLNVGRESLKQISTLLAFNV